ncbi:MAG: type II toxin-antitoxin system CcdA family antitoxin [Nanoarchaeota archaeon]|nr:type II toxin-antitoxin system CcdA family antitoxin [Nanoarchaeota archaeon]
MVKKTRKVRVNITVDEELLRQAQKKLKLFGGKLSTLFNAYLADFVKSMEKTPGKEHEELIEKIKDLGERVRKLEASKN